jgi:hypothetical protein
MQTWWLSFCDSARPKGSQFLGVAVVDVTEDDAYHGGRVGDAIRAAHGLGALEDDETVWLAGAVHKSHQTGCNPGGAVASFRIDQQPLFATVGPKYPRHQLLSKAELEAIDAEIAREQEPVALEGPGRGTTEA